MTTNPSYLSDEDIARQEKPIDEERVHLYHDIEIEQPIPQKKKMYKFVTQMKSASEGEYYWLTSIFSWETFEEYAKAFSVSHENIVCYTKIPAELFPETSTTDDLPF